MADGFAETAKVVQQRLGLRVELILIRLTEVPAIEHREVGMGMKRRQDETAFGVEDSMPFPQCGEWRRHVWQRQVAHKSIERAGFEGE